MKIILSYIKHFLNRIIRKSYWLYKLSKISFGKGAQLNFPIEIEGKGEIVIGSKSVLKKNVKIGVGENSSYEVGDNVLLENGSVILIDKGNKFKVGDNFKLGSNARLFVKNNWVFGNNVKIETYCSVFAREPHKTGKLLIGNNSNIGDYTIMDLVDDILIGNDVAIGPNSTLYTHDHIYTDKNLPAWKGGLVSKRIVIEDGAWVGSGVTLLPGVTIGKRAVIAAGSVVTKSVEANTIHGGIPAKFIKNI
jgi:acetyltransferase-like isoleucine patch superfamily enzyme